MTDAVENRAASGRRLTSISKVFTLLFVVLVGSLVGVMLFVLYQLTLISESADETLHEVLPRSQNQYEQAANVSGLFQAVNVILRSHDDQERREALREMARRSASMRPLLPLDEGQLLDSILIFSNDMGELHEQQHNNQAQIDFLYARELDLIQRVRDILREVRREATEGIESQLSAGAHMPHEQMEVLHSSVQHLGQASASASRLLEQFEQLHMFLLSLKLSSDDQHKESVDSIMVPRHRHMTENESQGHDHATENELQGHHHADDELPQGEAGVPIHDSGHEHGHQAPQVAVDHGDDHHEGDGSHAVGHGHETSQTTTGRGNGHHGDGDSHAGGHNHAATDSDHSAGHVLPVNRVKIEEHFGVMAADLRRLHADLSTHIDDDPLLAQLIGMIDEYTGFHRIFPLIQQRRMINQMVASTSNEIEVRLVSLANRLNSMADDISTRSTANIFKASELTTKITIAGVVLMLATILAVMLLVRRGLLAPLEQAGEALERMRGGAQSEITLPDSNLKEVASIHWSIQRLVETNREVHEATQKMEHEVALRRHSELQALQMQEQMVDAIESIADGFILFDADRRMVLCNSNFRRYYWQINDMLVVGEFSHDDFLYLLQERGVLAEGVDNGRLVAHLAECYRTLRISDDIQLQGGHWVSISSYLTKEGGTVCIHEDVTTRVESDSKLRRRAEMVHMLRDVAIYSNDAHNMLDAMRVCLEHICRFCGFSIGHVYAPTDEQSPVLTSLDAW